MGRAWDRSGVAFQPETWAEALRVAKPGAYLLAFGGTRTYHRLTCAIEDAGWILEDSIGVMGWVHAQGFPKGKNKLKPAWEPIVLARKRGAGVLNVDACRVPATDKAKFPTGYSKATGGTYAQDAYSKAWTCGEDRDPAGRWPTNLVFVHHPDCQQTAERVVSSTGAYPAHRSPSGFGRVGTDSPERRAVPDQVVPVMDCVPGCPVAELDAQSGTSHSPDRPVTQGGRKSVGGIMNSTGGQRDGIGIGYGDSGGASRFYPAFRFNPKADTWERPTIVRPDGTVFAHPTVKPVDLIRWLWRLVLPPGGLGLDMFAGSGAGLQAAQIDGFRSVGIESDAEHCALIRERLTWPWETDDADRFRRIRPKRIDPGAVDIFALMEEEGA
jgi:site-specific DNA-methyltransferase (adenine-specific)